LYYLHEIARKYPREKKYSSSFYDSVGSYKFVVFKLDNTVISCLFWCLDDCATLQLDTVTL
jgi:hypothetical protein